jgi:putative membrane-bound dehydrogenase-like protein
MQHALLVVLVLVVVDVEAQPKRGQPLPPGEAASRMTLPDGFHARLVAAEPDLVQPIAFTWDTRGRLWVAECYSYPTWKPEGRDRILIFEDLDGDGAFDARKVFWDKGNFLTGFEIGFGGVWVASAPNLLFIPDRDGDDRPDGPPEVHLDGWSHEGVHNVLNGLTWGPDGWLYGGNGILAPSKVGTPETPIDERPDLNCGIWRYHPTKRLFEVVAHGTTNPWGIDFDEHGQMFISNCVIPHLFHVVLGAHYRRMFGKDYNPFVYDLIKTCADHIHWDGGAWQKSGRGSEKTAELGGGHAHAGAMIYLGDNWPASYRNHVFVSNIHGHRINHDFLERRGSGYVAKHSPDFLSANHHWFWGLELKYGPDGDVYITDWCDDGECHGKDPHRESGRIFRITWGKPTKSRPCPPDLAKLRDAELVDLQLHRNEWIVRTARRVLHERAAAGRLAADTRARLRAILDDHPDEARKLRALWCLHAAGGLDEAHVLELLTHSSEYVRGWTVQLELEDRTASQAILERLAAMAKSDTSALVRLYLASALQRLELAQRWNIVKGLVTHEEDAKDPNLPLMIWYGIEPLVAAEPTRAVKLITTSKIPTLRKYISRRITERRK